MLPFLSFAGRQLSTYGLLGVLGFGVGLVVALGLAKRFSLDAQICAFLWVFGGIGGVVGAKLLYLFTLLPALVESWDALLADPGLLAQLVLSGGLVFYGSVGGAVVGAVLTARYFKVSLLSYLPALVPSFPLFHVFGRIGCFCAGCCYGVEASWGIAFTHAIAAPNGVPLVPVQLLEAGCELVIFFIVFASVLSGRKKRDPLKVLGLYLTLYAPVRFGLEFWRGDAIRGFLGALSTSQWLSIAALAIGVFFLARGVAALPSARIKGTKVVCAGDALGNEPRTRSLV